MPKTVSDEIADKIMEELDDELRGYVGEFGGFGITEEKFLSDTRKVIRDQVEFILKRHGMLKIP